MFTELNIEEKSFLYRSKKDRPVSICLRTHGPTLLVLLKLSLSERHTGEHMFADQNGEEKNERTGEAKADR